MNRDQLVTLRPIINTISTDQLNSPEEHFQSETLRPVLKFQNELLLALFEQYLRKHKTRFLTTSHQDKQDYIKQTIQKDQAFKNQLLGCIIGQFTLEEYKTFVAGEKEMRKRIVDLLIKRLQDQSDYFNHVVYP